MCLSVGWLADVLILSMSGARYMELRCYIWAEASGRRQDDASKDRHLENVSGNGHLARGSWEVACGMMHRICGIWVASNS